MKIKRILVSLCFALVVSVSNSALVLADKLAVGWEPWAPYQFQD